MEFTENLLVKSTGFLETFHATPVDMSDENDRLRQARIAAGYRSALHASRKFGWKSSTYASHENGQTPNIPKAAVQRYGKAFKVSWEWIKTGAGTMHPEVRTRIVKLAESLPSDKQPAAIEYLEFLHRR